MVIVAGTWGGAILYQTSVRPFIAVHERFVDYYIVGYGTFICRVFAWLISKIWNGSVALTRLILMRSTTKEQVKKSNDNMLRQREQRHSSYILPVAAHGTTYRKAAKALERERLRSYGPRQPSLPSSAQRAIPNRAAYQLGSPSIYHPASNARQPATPTAYNNSRKKVTPALARIRDQNPATSPRAATSQLAGWNAPTSTVYSYAPFLVSPLAGRSTRRANVERVPMFPELGLLEDDQDGPLAASTPARPNRKSDKSYTTKGMPSPFLVDGGQHPAELSSSLPGVPGDFPTPVVRKRPAVDEELPMSDNRKRAKHRAALLQQKRSHTAIDKMANETSDMNKQAELAAAAAAAMVNTIESTTTDMKEKEMSQWQILHRQELDSTPDNVIEPSPASVIMINDTTEDEEDEDEEDGDENEIDEDAEETNEPITIDLPNQAYLEQAAAEMSESDFDIINPTRRRSKSRYLSLPKIRFSPDTTRSKPPSSTSIDASANTMDTNSRMTTMRNRKKSHQRQSIKSNS
ncbi:hypothetical protein BDF22DRAFT_745509 [Syncephalis plumigaleata]|nr:hypothetical protein BDF22DRAFT_745509 [Syncephalis plumigaleata]